MDKNPAQAFNGLHGNIVLICSECNERHYPRCKRTTPDWKTCEAMELKDLYDLYCSCEGEHNCNRCHAISLKLSK